VHRRSAGSRPGIEEAQWYRSGRPPSCPAVAGRPLGRTAAHGIELREHHGFTILVATHDAQVAARCDRVVRLLDGRVTDDVDVRGASDPAGTMARLSRPAPR
jgi:hypothetical protein